jgi:hypothetical protein
MQDRPEPSNPSALTPQSKKKPIKGQIAKALIISLGITALGSALFAWATAARLSSAVAIVSKGTAISNFLAKPGPSFVEAYFRFEPELADDVVFGLDQELIEGINNPYYVKGADWMALVGLQRPGNLWVATGTQQSEQGSPNSESERTWKILSVGQTLKPKQWYRIKCIADFATRKFKSFEIEGASLKKTVDLSNLRVEYPNYMPFDGRAMTYYVYAMRSRSMMKTRGKPIVQFDDLRGGYLTQDGREVQTYFCDFEKQNTVGNQPVTLPVIQLDKYEQGRLYLEREQAHFRIEANQYAHSGRQVGVAEADID